METQTENSNQNYRVKARLITVQEIEFALRATDQKTPVAHISDMHTSSFAAADAGEE